MLLFVLLVVVVVVVWKQCVIAGGFGVISLDAHTVAYNLCMYYLISANVLPTNATMLM
jgi:hypothetical protein